MLQQLKKELDNIPKEAHKEFVKVTQDSATNVIDIVRTLILDEQGKEILNKDNMLPTGVLMKAISKVTEMLGK